MFKKILVPFDGSSHSFRSAQLAIKLSRTCKSEIYGIFVIDEDIIEDISKISEKTGHEVKQEFMEKGVANMSWLENLCKKNGIKFTGKIVEGYPGQIILQYSSVIKADLIIVGHRSHRKTIMAHAMGSVTKYIIEMTKVPVLVVN
ncbi:MAG: universal stress protein [Candidatus Helarchaeota archaeon]